MARKKPARPPRKPAPESHGPDGGGDDARPFPIIGIGASAGGLEAMKLLLSSMPSRSRLAIVYLQHLDPTHESFLVPLLAATSSMRVVAAEDGERISIGTVYVAPPHHEVEVAGGKLRLTPLPEGMRVTHSIDNFLQSLAKDLTRHSVGVILSGNGSDGARGLAAIKAVGGTVLVQNPVSAKFDGMPRSAAASAGTDCVLPPEEIAQALARIARRIAQGKRAGPALPRRPVPADGDPFARIANLIWTEVGVDIHAYKPAMIRRRILRRMALRHMKGPEAYADFLQKNPDAVAELFSDLLIKVTRFFRDPDTFRALKSRVIPAILKDRPDGMAVRVWVPGCASGEEAYSIAMCLIEAIGDDVRRYPIQVFGTDLDESAVRRARAGHFSAQALRGVSPERRSRFFRPVEGGYEIDKSVREVCVYARHDLTRDPPFSNLDLVSCRNVLIYLQVSMQRRVMQVFHYALRPGGFLVLGTAETAGQLDIFSVFANKTRRIYLRRAVPARGRVELTHADLLPDRLPTRARAGPTVPWDALGEAHREADRIVMGRFAPPGVLVNERLEIVQFRGDTSPYLVHAQGEASLSLLKMARTDLAMEIRPAIAEARRNEVPVRRTGLRLHGTAGVREASIEVIPMHLASSKKPYFLVLFQDVVRKAAPSMPSAPDGSEAKPAARRKGEGEPARLERELRVTRERLHSVSEEHDATTEELRAAMEELTSSNEELQSINEELETAKEELQSTNEELTTLNEELQCRNVELSHVNVDVQNLLASVDIPIVMLGRDLKIRRFTRPAELLFRMIASDVGRPITDLRPALDVPDLDQQLRRVVGGSPALHSEVRDSDGRSYSLWIRPYVTVEGKSDGVVVALFDITDLRRAEEAVRQHARRLELLSEIDASILEGRSFESVAQHAISRLQRFVPATDAGLLLLDEPHGEVALMSFDASRPENAAPRPTERFSASQFGGPYALSSADNLSFEDLGTLSHCPMALETLRARGMRSMLSVPLAHDHHVFGRFYAADGAPRVFHPEHIDAARAVADHLAVAYVHEQLRAQIRAAQERLQSLAQSLVEAQEAERRRVARELHDEVGQILTGVKLSLVPAIETPGLTPKVAAGLSSAVEQIERLISIVRSLSLELRPTVLDDLGLLPALVTHFERFTAQTGVQVKLEQEGAQRRFPAAVETAAYRIIQEALTNVARHAGIKEATVRLWGDDEKLDLQIEDRGAGFDPKAHRISSGLSGMSERAAALGGELTIDAAPARGARLLASLPAAAERRKKEA